jgi:hypothetical protein
VIFAIIIINLNIAILAGFGKIIYEVVRDLIQKKKKKPVKVPVEI